MIKGFKMKLYEGQEAEYERRHNLLWPEMKDMIHEHGGKNYTIFLDRETLTLFGYIEIENEELWAKGGGRAAADKDGIDVVIRYLIAHHAQMIAQGFAILLHLIAFSVVALAVGGIKIAIGAFVAAKGNVDIQSERFVDFLFFHKANSSFPVLCIIHPISKQP